jgi:tRNA dimethylallyltransferase
LRLPDERPPLFALVGPTAVGKTALGIALAQESGADIVSADSRQVFRPLTIGSAKPSPEELAAVRHHFIGELELEEPFSAGRFAEEATRRIREIRQGGGNAIVLGGATLYLEALLHGLSDVPRTSVETRERLEERLAIEGADRLYEELISVDPDSAATMDASKTQRLVRALEVYYDTGQRLSAFHGSAPPPPFRPVVVVITRPRPVLYDRINRRVDAMLEEGLLEENQALIDAGIPANLNPLRTIGYQEPMAFLRGEIPFEEMVRRLKQNSRRYAKRQLTWFRRREEYQWVNLEAEANPVEAVLRLWGI